MNNTPNNIFAEPSSESLSKVQSITQHVKDFSQSIIKKIQQLVANIKINQQTSQKIAQNLTKTKQFFKQNKQVIIGVTLITALYIANERRSQKVRNSKSKHIHSLTTNPNSQLRRSGSNKKQLTNPQTLIQNKQNRSKSKSKKVLNPKLNYLRAFISQGQQQDQEYIRSDEEDKDNPDLSASTRRTESMVSDIEPLKKKKKRNLQPIMDLVEQQDQTQDRVFFQMFRTYRES